MTCGGRSVRSSLIRWTVLHNSHEAEDAGQGKEEYVSTSLVYRVIVLHVYNYMHSLSTYIAFYMTKASVAPWRTSVLEVC